MSNELCLYVEAKKSRKKMALMSWCQSSLIYEAFKNAIGEDKLWAGDAYSDEEHFEKVTGTDLLKAYKWLSEKKDEIRYMLECYQKQTVSTEALDTVISGLKEAEYAIDELDVITEMVTTMGYLGDFDEAYMNIG